jgi:exopolysaccharide biosynthesis polyprenyl glycosylphosphotransferase
VPLYKVDRPANMYLANHQLSRAFDVAINTCPKDVQGNSGTASWSRVTRDGRINPPGQILTALVTLADEPLSHAGCRRARSGPQPPRNGVRRMASITHGLPGPRETEENAAGGHPGVALVGPANPEPMPAIANDGMRRQAVPFGSDPSSPRGEEKRANLRRHLMAGDVLALAVVWVPLAVVGTATPVARQIACSAAACVAGMLAIQRAGLYRARVCAVRSLEAVRVGGASIIAAFAFSGTEWLTGSAQVARATIGAAAATASILLMRWRFSRWLKTRRSTGEFLRTIVLIGTNEDTVSFWQMITEEPELGYRVGAVIGDNPTGAPWEDLPTARDIRELTRLAHAVDASGVIVMATALGATDASTAVNASIRAGLHVQVWPGLMGVSNRRLRIAPLLGVPVLYVEPKRAAKWQLAVKRLIDIILTVVILPLVIPVLLVAALLIKLEDRGPVFYRHRVVGRFGAPITVLKLRTMVPNAAKMLSNVAALNERTGGPLFKASSDPRVTRIGRFLRASSLDELPQLWDVMRGTMSLVGPRFALPAEVEQFDDELRRRTEMRPGMTGLWQSEARDNPSFSAYRRLDLFYIDNWSLSLDVAILANTLHGVGVRALRAVFPARPTPVQDPVPQPAMSKR